MHERRFPLDTVEGREFRLIRVGRATWWKKLGRIWFSGFYFILIGDVGQGKGMEDLWYVRAGKEYARSQFVENNEGNLDIVSTQQAS